MRKLLFLNVGTITYDCDINFLEPLRKIFSEVINYNYIQRSQQIGESAMNHEILRVCAAEKPDYVFLHSHRFEIYKSTLARISTSGIPTIIWFSDDHYRFENYSKDFGAVIDYAVTTDHHSVDKYRSLGIPVILSQWAANPDYYHPVECSASIDVSFVGAKNEVRERFINELIKKGINVQAYGKDWQLGPVSFQKMVEIFSCSKINLNFGTYWAGTEYRTIKGRVFEVVMSGGLLLTDYLPELEEYFVNNREILCFEDIDQAAIIIQKYLADDHERRAIAKAGYERALRDHTWQKRLTDLFQEIEKRKQAQLSTTTRTAAPVRSIQSRTFPINDKNTKLLDAFPVSGENYYLVHKECGEVCISISDLSEGLCYITSDDSKVETKNTNSHFPYEDSSQDFIFSIKGVDNLDLADIEKYFQECSRTLSEQGLFIGSTRLWYANDEKSIRAHKHRGHKYSHTSVEITKALRKYFHHVKLYEIHRPMGPMGPFTIFIASKNKNNLSNEKMADLVLEIKKVQQYYKSNKKKMNLHWSFTLYQQGNYNLAKNYALQSLMDNPASPSSWAAIVRSTIGRFK